MTISRVRLVCPTLCLLWNTIQVLKSSLIFLLKCYYFFLIASLYQGPSYSLEQWPDLIPKSLLYIIGNILAAVKVDCPRKNFQYYNSHSLLSIRNKDVIFCSYNRETKAQVLQKLGLLLYIFNRNQTLSQRYNIPITINSIGNKKHYLIP